MTVSRGGAAAKGRLVDGALMWITRHRAGSIGHPEGAALRRLVSGGSVGFRR
ncbi:hypothetical protein BJY16_004522 [Actinoplanes octamycinicus]|uniref:Uncharacterized protein n=1 Tax=Actinoplanes octamycinicus TaxID=135948 RepID=A0A7W7M8L7_9ACTN|nr:hypothetical protein [Actinoplanes octamycinicus]